ncbi:MAG: transposase [Ferroplasma sp.]|uniref:transposase n=1 Tax=Ferroplasma sp. TaxID=2591003 RepID=UPI00281656A4|nr:transposase [Ferroplasma sp.]WMT50865.1 MAG: transposase [Ferroplasma sp.]WMT51060.1 MAG: transposase [Ferroplasma sp.]
MVKLRAYTGVVPVTKQSGRYNTSSHISKSGNSIIRHTLYLSTISAIRFNPVVKRYYCRKKEAGMSGNELIISCSNKLLNIIYSVLKNNQEFKDPEARN